MPARFPLYKGATRVATVAGVPLIPLVVLVVVAANAAMLFGVWWLGLMLPGWALMAQITKSDDRAFRIVWLWLQTKFANWIRAVVLASRKDVWGASTYSLSDGRRRAWEGRESSWRG